MRKDKWLVKVKNQRKAKRLKLVKNNGI